jgi:hypothetical protein
MRPLGGATVEKIGLVIEFVSRRAQIGSDHPVLEETRQTALAGGFLP